LPSSPWDAPWWLLQNGCEPENPAHTVAVDTLAVMTAAAVVSQSIAAANPASIGLLGFGMTTILLKLRNAGYEGIFCGLSAFYAGVAAVINEIHGTDIPPAGAKKS